MNSISMSLSTLNASIPGYNYPTNKEENTMITITEGVTYQPYRPNTGAANWVPTYSPLHEAESILFNRNIDRENRMNIVSSIAVDLKEEIGEIIAAASLFGPHGYEVVKTPSTKKQMRQIRKIRRALNKVFRTKMSVFEAQVRVQKAEMEARLKEENRAYTQHMQWEATCDIMQEAYERKLERQAKHQARIEKMKAKKVDGKTPKQVVKRTRKTKVNPVKAITTVGIQLTKREKQDIAMGLEWARYQRINKRKTNKEVFALEFKEFKHDHDIRKQGRKMRAIVSALMNKEVK